MSGWHAWDMIERPIQPIVQEAPTSVQDAPARERIQADDPNALSHRVCLPGLQDPSRKVHRLAGAVLRPVAY